MAVQPWGDYFSKLTCRFGLQWMYFFDTDNHHVPHIHVEHGEFSVALAIVNGEILAGEIPKSKRKRAQVWAEIHREDLAANWKLAVEGRDVFKIDPLK